MRSFVNRIIQIIHFYLLGPLFCHILAGPFCMTCKIMTNKHSKPISPFAFAHRMGDKMEEDETPRGGYKEALLSTAGKRARSKAHTGSGARMRTTRRFSRRPPSVGRPSTRSPRRVLVLVEPRGAWSSPTPTRATSPKKNKEESGRGEDLPGVPHTEGLKPYTRQTSATTRGGGGYGAGFTHRVEHH